MFLLHFVKIIIVHCWRTNEFGQSFLPSSSSKFVQTHNTKIEEDGKSLKRFKNLSFLKSGCKLTQVYVFRSRSAKTNSQQRSHSSSVLGPFRVNPRYSKHGIPGYCPSKNPTKREKEKKRHIEKLGRFHLKIQIRIPFGKRRKIRGIDGLVERWVKSGKKEGRERKEKGGERVIHSTAKKSMWQSPRSFVPAASSARSAIVLI